LEEIAILFDGEDARVSATLALSEEKASIHAIEGEKKV
jgi:hypothetical protein